METKRYSFIWRFVWLLVCLLTVRANAGEPIQITAKPIFEAGSTIKFRDGVSIKYNSFRIPSLSRTENGTLIAIAEGWSNQEAGDLTNCPRTDVATDKCKVNAGDRTDLVMRRSFDGGVTWQEPVGLIRGQDQLTYNGEWRAMYSNPTQVVDPTTNTVFLHYIQWLGGTAADSARPNTTDNMAFVIKSTDNGATWIGSDQLNPQNPDNITGYVKDYVNWDSIAYGPGSGIYVPFDQTKGRLIIPATRHGKSTSYGPNTCVSPDECKNHNVLDLYSVYSDDHGASWHRGIDVIGNYAKSTSSVSSGDEKVSCRYAQGNENQVVSLANGSLYLQARPAFNRRADLPLDSGGCFNSRSSSMSSLPSTVQSDYQIIRNSNVNTSAIRDPYPDTQDQRGVHWNEAINEAVDRGMKLPQVQTAVERYTLQTDGDDKNRILWTGPTAYTPKVKPDPYNLSIRVSKDETKDLTEARLSELTTRKLWDGVAWYSDIAVDKNKNFVGVLFEAHGLLNAPAITDDTIYFTAVNRAFLEPPAGLIAWEPFTYNRDAYIDTDDQSKHGGLGWTTEWSQDKAIPADNRIFPQQLIENSDLLYGSNYRFTVQGNRRLFFTSPQVTDFTLARAFSPMIDLGKTQAYYISMLVRVESPSNSSLDIKLLNGITPGVGFGLDVVSTTYSTNNPNQSLVFNLYTNGGNVKNQKPIDLSVGQTFMLVFKIAAAASSSTAEYVYAKAYLGRKAQTSSSGEVIPLHENVASGFGGWDVATKSTVAADMKMDRILISTGTGAGFVIDDLRIGTTWEAVVSNQE